MKRKGTIRRRSKRGRNRKEEGEVKEKELGTYSHSSFFFFSTFNSYKVVRNSRAHWVKNYPYWKSKNPW